MIEMKPPSRPLCLIRTHFPDAASLENENRGCQSARFLLNCVTISEGRSTSCGRISGFSDSCVRAQRSERGAPAGLERGTLTPGRPTPRSRTGQTARGPKRVYSHLSASKELNTRETNQFVRGIFLIHLVIISWTIKTGQRHRTFGGAVGHVRERPRVGHMEPCGWKFSEPRRSDKYVEKLAHPASWTVRKVTFPAVCPLPPAVLTVPATRPSPLITHGVGLEDTNSSWKALSNLETQRSLPIKLHMASGSRSAHYNNGGANQSRTCTASVH